MVEDAARAEEYLQRTGIAETLEGLREILERDRPDDPRAFAVNFILDRGGGEGDHEPAGAAAGTPAPPARPAFMVAPDAVTQAMRERQLTEPQKWSLSLGDLHAVLGHCERTDVYDRLKREDAAAKNKPMAEGKVSMYKINDNFVKPWSANTGCGTSILTNPVQGVDAQLMISHAWGEDVSEFREALYSWQRDVHAPDDLFVWFCLFANYQCEDGAGPDIPAQIAMDPFATVIASDAIKSGAGGRGMLAVHTTTCDLYGRLWCVHDVERAIAEAHVLVAAALSNAYTQEVVDKVAFVLDHGGNHESALDAAGVTVRTALATCSVESDREMLFRKILSTDGEFAHLDAVVCGFRRQTLPDTVLWRLTEAGMRLDPVNKHGTQLMVALLACGAIGIDRLEQVMGDLIDDPALQLLSGRALTGMVDRLTLASPLAFAGSVEALVHMGADEIVALAVTKLRELLARTDGASRCAAARGLGHLGEHAPLDVASLLAECLRDEDRDVRAAVSEALEHLGAHAATAAPSMLEVMTDPDPRVRLSSARFLGLLGERAPPEAAHALVERLLDVERDIRAAATEALQQMGTQAAASAPSMLKFLLRDDVDDRLGAARCLGRLGEHAPAEAARALWWRVEDEHEDENVRAEAAKALGQMGALGATVAPMMLEMLVDDDEDARMRAVQALAQLGAHAPPEAAEALLLRLRDDDEYVRAEAAKAMGQMGAQAAKVTPAILEMLSADDHAARSTAASALGFLGVHAPLAAARALSEHLEDDDALVRAAVADALGQLGAQSDDFTPALLKTCADGDWRVRLQAVQAISRLSDHRPSEAAHALDERLRDEHERVRAAASKALEQIHAHQTALAAAMLEPVTDGDERVRSFSVLFPGLGCEEGPPLFVGAGMVPRHMLGVWCEDAPPEAAAALVARLADGRGASEDVLRRLIVERRFRVAEVVPPLLRGALADDPATASACLRALGQVAVSAAGAKPLLAAELALRLGVTPGEVLTLADGVCQGILDSARVLSRAPP